MDRREPASESAWRFYGRLLRQTPQAIWEAGGHFQTLVLLVLAVLFLANRHLAESVSSWEGISPLWAIVPFAVLILLGLLRANHNEFKKMRAERSPPPQQSIGQYVHQQFVVATPEQAAELVEKVPPVELRPSPPKVGDDDGTMAD